MKIVGRMYVYDGCIKVKKLIGWQNYTKYWNNYSSVTWTTF